jgi:hypothetical protein
MNKSFGGNLRLNSQLNGKITNPPLMLWVNLIKKLKCYQPIACAI